MAELNEKELLGWVDDAQQGNVEDFYPTFSKETIRKDKEIYQKIVRIVKLHFSDDWQQVKKDLGEFMKKQRPKVTKEFVEKWMKKMTETYPASSTDTWLFRKQLTKMLKEVGVKIEEQSS